MVWRRPGSNHRFFNGLLASSFVLAVLLLAGGCGAQVPNPNRSVHPAIADPAPGVFPESAPLLAVSDGVWNHGEGFPAVGLGEDWGGWFNVDDGTNLAATDVHEWVVPGIGSGWQPFSWVDNAPPYGSHPMRRFGGYLRRGGVATLPTTHPLYGALGQPYVDQGAFEAFAPTASYSPGQTILICIRTRATAGFPANHLNKRYEWRQIYRGIFSPDGLVRREKAGSRNSASFIGNTDLNDVDRPTLGYLADWGGNPDFYPIVAYPVLSVMHRSTTLNEQRHLQLVQAVKWLLQENNARNPLGAANRLSAQEIESRVVVCFAGGSNGGHQSHWAALRHPQIVHGCYAEVINPSIQRLYNQHDQFHLATRLSGSGFYGAVVRESDFLWWDQYLWSHGIEAHDISWPRLFASGQTYRPACFVVGDEDNTSNGTDWVGLASGSTWSDHGLVGSSSTFGSPANNTFGWMVADTACHQDLVVPTVDPYVGGPPQFGGTQTAQSLFSHAVNQRAAELINGQQAPAQPLVHQPRTAAQQMRGLDDPHEWFLGRPLGGLEPVDVNAVLKRDDAFFSNSQPGACGTMPGGREAMVIAGGKLYVGCTEGVVTCFEVDENHPTGRKPLVAVARSVKLGNDAFALAAGSGDFVYVGTRRHLYKLNPTTLAIAAGPVELPWEVAQPRHMVVDEVLTGSTGLEIVFHSIHGGLVFYRASDLTPVYEWTEPGIVDFEINAGLVAILSSRGVVANVSFTANGSGSYAASLEAVSRPIPAHLVAPSSPTVPGTADLPSQGVPEDLEMMRVNWGSFGNNLAAISLWSGDEDGRSVRAHWHSTLQAQQYLPNLAAVVDVATCSITQAGSVGDHALVLGQDAIWLYDQFQAQVGFKKLCFDSAWNYYSFAAQGHSMVVGELATHPGSPDYSEEVVVATNTGLFWMHVQDLVDPTGSITLPAGYQNEIASTGSQNTSVQPHTNMCLGAAYAISTEPQDGYLHVMDSRGNYWLVDSAGSVTLQDRENVRGVKKWSYLGSPIAPASINAPHLVHLPPVTPGAFVVPQYGDKLLTSPWCPVNTSVVVFETGATAHLGYNWFPRTLQHGFFAGFALFSHGGGVLSAGPNKQAWSWSASYDGQPWSNMFEGFEISQAGDVVGLWASTAATPSGGVNGAGFGDLCAYHNLRTQVSTTEVFNLQSVRPVRLSLGSSAGQEAIVLGCPGGRVRVLQPGQMRTPASGHAIGSVKQSDDFGYGGAALAVRHETSSGQDVVRIWFGTLGDNLRRPSGYSVGSSSLQDSELSAGAIHVMEWRPGSSGGTFTNVSTVQVYPTFGATRGIYGVVGLEVADLLPGFAGDELVVTTLSGDIIIYSADTMVEIWRDHVLGCAGMYNSIVVDDLDADGANELYVGGSWGVWRFFQ